jgi:NitT/TauT family transport system substrate-binding protein
MEIVVKALKIRITVRGMRRITAAVAAAIAMCLALAGCLSSSGAATGGGGVEKPNLTVAVVPAVDSAGFFVALHQGLFTAQGLHVTFVPAVSSETVIAQQVKGTVDISGGNYVSYIQAQADHEANLEIFAEGSIVQPGTQALYTMPNTKITTLRDLIGKTIGINAPFNILYLLVASVLADNGIPVNKVHFDATIPLPEMAAELKAGKISAAVLPEPFGSEAETADGATELADLDQGATSSFPLQGYAVTRAWAKENPRTLAAFNTALQQGQEIADTDRTAVEQAMESLPMKPEPLGVTADVAAMMALDTYPVGRVNVVRLQRVADVMEEFIGFGSFKVASMVANPGG